MKDIQHKDIHSKVGGKIGVKSPIDEGFIEKEWGD